MKKFDEDDNVLIVRGKDDEIYFIDDPLLIIKLEAIFKSFPAAGAMSIVLPMLNPKKHK